jgi:hypothetical protein
VVVATSGKETGRETHQFVSTETEARQCGIVSPLSATREQAKRHFQAADTAYDALKRHTPAYRYEFLCDRATNKSGEVPVAAQKAASRMLQQEKQ